MAETTPAPPVPNARQVVADVLHFTDTGAVAGFGELFAEDAVFELPYAALGAPVVRTGAAEIRAWLSEGSAGRPPRPETTRLSVVYETSDPEVVVVEFEGHEKESPDGGTYVPRYVSLIRVRAGKIVHYRHYAEPSKWLRVVSGEAP